MLMRMSLSCGEVVLYCRIETPKGTAVTCGFDEKEIWPVGKHGALHIKCPELRVDDATES